MTEIAEHERRLAAALDRMGAAHARTRQALHAAQTRIAELEAQTDGAPSQPDSAQSAELEALREELATQKQAAEAARAEAEAATARLTAQSDEAADRHSDAEADRATIDQLRGEIAALTARDRLETVKSAATGEDLTARVSQLEQAVQSLQRANAQLRQNNAALRKAHEAGLPDEKLVEQGVQAELEGLRAARAADRAEIDSILAALQPLIEETADA